MAEAKQLEKAGDQIQKTGEDLDSMQRNVIVAPYSLAILGQVMLLATKSDFSLISKPVPDGSKDVKFFEGRGDFKYITHPESFRATLVQVSILSSMNLKYKKSCFLLKFSLKIF